MLSLQSFSTEGHVVGPCWEKFKPKGSKGKEHCPIMLGARRTQEKDLEDEALPQPHLSPFTFGI